MLPLSLEFPDDVSCFDHLTQILIAMSRERASSDLRAEVAAGEVEIQSVSEAVRSLNR